MRKWRVSFTAAVAVMAVFLVPVSARAHAPALPKVTVVASGLNNPRGLAFGPDGALYVAEGGTGGTASTAGQCAQVRARRPLHGRVHRQHLQDLPPRNQDRGGIRAAIKPDRTPTGSLVSGVADVAFGPGGKLFALIAGAGCSHGLKGTSNQIVRVHRDGSVTTVADLSAFLKAHPVANPETIPKLATSSRTAPGTASSPPGAASTRSSPTTRSWTRSPPTDTCAGSSTSPRPSRATPTGAAPRP